MLMKMQSQKNYKTNFQIAISAFNEARDDHYDGVNAIYRLAAEIKVPKETCEDGVERQAQKLVKDLSKLSVRPNRIYIDYDSYQIVWYPKDYQMAMNRGQYVGLLVEFADFLNNSPIPNLKIQDGCYMDEPEGSVKSVSNDMINFFPEFNSTCFGAEDDEPIQIINLVELPKYREVA